MSGPTAEAPNPSPTSSFSDGAGSERSAASPSQVIPKPRRANLQDARALAGFFLISVGLCLALFWPSATGKTLMAPLDLAPNLFSKFKYVDPAATGVPANHYLIDLFESELPRNWLVHQAWKRGEMPWWDPFTDGGKPMAAEANAINATDPFKVLLYHLLPFELAFNWARILPFIVSGLGAFCLLRRFEFGFAPALWGGLLYQFAGGNAIMFAGPTVQASFSYSPWLWLMWDRAAEQKSLKGFALSSLIAALFFLSGNLQSHTYVFFFAVAYLIGYGWSWSGAAKKNGSSRTPVKVAGETPAPAARLRFLTAGVALSLSIGLALVAPFILSQVEMFLLRYRQLLPMQNLRGMFSGIFSLATVFPWALGTFRTLDGSKLVQQTSLGFWAYIGSAALVIAVLGAMAPVGGDSRRRNSKRTALVLIAIYLGICSTPLLRLFYTRTAWLAVLGLVVLFALGWQRISLLEFPLKRWGVGLAIFALAIALILNVGGAVIYPHFQSRVETFVLKNQKQKATLDEAPALRRFQVANLPREVTFRNREPLVAFLSLIALAAFLWLAPAPGRQIWLWMILILSTLPLLWFVHRYVPQQPLALWEKIRAGGPEQRRVVEAVREKGLRLREDAAGQHEYVFPGAMAQLFGVHLLHGATSIGPYHAGYATNSSGQADPLYADVVYRSPKRQMERGELEFRTDGPPARFHWASPNSRPVEIVSETLNTITLAIGPGPAGELIRTDTYYPGWHVASGPPGVSLSPDPPFSARITVPETVTRLQLAYEPRWLRPGLCVACAGAVLLVFFLLKRIRTI